MDAAAEESKAGRGAAKTLQGLLICAGVVPCLAGLVGYVVNLLFDKHSALSQTPEEVRGMVFLSILIAAATVSARLARKRYAFSWGAVLLLVVLAPPAVLAAGLALLVIVLNLAY